MNSPSHSNPRSNAAPNVEHNERGSGRAAHSPTEALILRLRSLTEALETSPPKEFGAFCFLAEQTAWATLQIARALLFDHRSDHLPKSESDLFAAWVKQGWLALAESRRLKQFAELRNLSSQEPEKLNERGIRESTIEGISFVKAFLELAQTLVK